MYNLNETFKMLNKKYLKENLQEQIDSDYIIYEDDDILVKMLDADNPQENKLARDILAYPISKIIGWIFIVGPIGIILNKETDKHIIFTIDLRQYQQKRIWFEEDRHSSALDGEKIKELFGVGEQVAKEIIKSINKFNTQEYLENAFDGEEYMTLRKDAEEEATKDLDRELTNLVSEYSGIDVDDDNFHNMLHYVIKNCHTHKDIDFLENDDFETNYDGELFCIYDGYDKMPKIKSEIKKCVERGLR